MKKLLDVSSYSNSVPNGGGVSEMGRCSQWCLTEIDAEQEMLFVSRPTTGEFWLMEEDKGRKRAGFGKYATCYDMDERCFML
jgi:hypothetical protein